MFANWFNLDQMVAFVDHDKSVISTLSVMCSKTENRYEVQLLQKMQLLCPMTKPVKSIISILMTLCMQVAE